MQKTPSAPARWQFSFFSIWTGQQLSHIGSMLAQFALVWWVTKTTGSATVLATATMVAMLPGVLLGPFAGAYVDRANRRKVMIVADGFVALAAAAIAVLFWSGQIQIWHIYVVMLARSLGGMFHWPAMQASTSLMVPQEHYARVAGLNQTMSGALAIVAPPLGALLLSLLPLHGIMAIDVVTAILAITPLFFVRIPQPTRQAGASAGVTPRSLWHDVGEGLRFIYRWPGMFRLLLMAALLNLVLSPAFSLTPILVTKHFMGEALELGWMNSSFGVGMLLGGLLLGIWGGFRRRIMTSLLGVTGMGLGILAIGLAPASLLPMALAGMFVTGAMQPLANGPLFAIFQATVPPEMQGRVFTVIGSLSGMMAPLGMAIAGPVADLWGVPVWYVVGGIGCIALALYALSNPTVLYLEDQAAANQAASTAPATAVSGIEPPVLEAVHE